MNLTRVAKGAASEKLECTEGGVSILWVLLLFHSTHDTFCWKLLGRSSLKPGGQMDSPVKHVQLPITVLGTHLEAYTSLGSFAHADHIRKSSDRTCFACLQQQIRSLDDS